MAYNSKIEFEEEVPSFLKTIKKSLNLSESKNSNPLSLTGSVVEPKRKRIPKTKDKDLQPTIDNIDEFSQSELQQLDLDSHLTVHEKIDAPSATKTTTNKKHENRKTKHEMAKIKKQKSKKKKTKERKREVKSPAQEEPKGITSELTSLINRKRKESGFDGKKRTMKKIGFRKMKSIEQISNNRSKGGHKELDDKK